MRLHTLGDAALWRARDTSSRERILDVGKPLALLIYLTCAQNREAHRNHLCELLWSQMDPDTALRALRQTLHLLRQRTQLGDNLFERRGDRIALVAPIESDRDALLAASAAGDVERVVQLYAGDFLTGFAAPGGVQFDLWAETERRALRRVFAHSAEEVIRVRIANGRTRDALALARRVRDIDPRSQAAWRRVLECSIASSDSVAVRIELEALRRLCEAEGIDPEAATLAGMRDAQAVFGRPTPNGNGETTTEGGLVAELVGREREFAVLTRAWDEAVRGQARRFHIVAPAGFGKTRLLLELRARLRSIGGRVVYVRATYGTRDLPFAFASEVAASLARLRGAGGISQSSAGALVALNPALSSHFSAERDTTTGDEALRRRGLALRELLTSVADEQPIVLLLDDLHWSDLPSFRALNAALGDVDRAHALIVSAARPSSDEVRQPQGALRVEIAALSEDDVGTLVSSIADLPDESWATSLRRAIREATDGSPLLVLESLQSLMDQSLLVRGETTWRVSDIDSVVRVLAQGSGLRRRIERLDRDEQRILQTLAVAGSGVDVRVLSEVTACHGEELARRLVALEQRGLVDRSTDVVSIAHDEYAAAVLESASADALVTASTALGRAFADEAGDDARRMCLAGSMLARGDTEANRAHIDDLAQRFVRRCRLAGDGRPDRLIVRELLGSSATDSVERRVVRSLPWLVRARLVSPGRIAAAVAIACLVLLTGVAAWKLPSRDAHPPDAVLAVGRPAADGRAYDLFRVPIDASRWAGISVIDVRLAHQQWQQKALPGNGGYDPRPDGRGWTGGVSLADSGVIDIFDFDLHGDAHRLTFARSDDLEPSWAPDNSQFVFVTARWNHGRYDLAIQDTLTGRVRGLTFGDDTDEFPKWSPDGSRIAFSRTEARSGRRRLCVIDVDGANLECRPDASPSAPVRVLGWADAHRVYLWRDFGGNPQLARFDLDADSVDFTDDRDGDAIISPDGKFALCECPRRGYPARTWIVYPVERPNEFAWLRVVGGDDYGLQYRWAPTTPRQPWAARIEISVGLGPPLVGIAHQLTASGLDSAGRPVPLGVVRWRSEDTTVATIDSAGRLKPRRAGRVSIFASAGGWRDVHKTLTIAEADSRVLLDETWTDSLTARWRPFGVPRPILVTGAPFGHAFLNNGDGSFFSGAYTIRSFETKRGLWVEADVSTPITSGESQDLVIVLSNMDRDSVAWAALDHATGDGPVGISSPGWSVRYPRGEGGIHWGEQIEAWVPPDGNNFTVPPTARIGKPYHVVMQIFPDGRCGLAIDGKPLFVSGARLLEPRVHVTLSGNSVGTKLLVGRLRVLTGLAPNITWQDH
ncbi:MAG: AAA family ATPase [Gemmatimonadaceae bacterium]